MVNSINVNAFRRPGVFLSSTGRSSTPTPLSNHAVAYIVASVPGSNWENTSENYSTLTPNEPKQVTSEQDYLASIGGSIPNPTTDYAAWISYKSVQAFFRNSGLNGVLFVVKASVTPDVLVDVASTAAANKIAVKIDGSYYAGTPQTFLDSVGDQVSSFAVSGGGVDSNAFDMITALRADVNFNNAYRINYTQAELLLGKFRISSKEVGIIPNVTVTNYGTTGSVITGYSTVQVLTQNRALDFRLENTTPAQYVLDKTTVRNLYSAGSVPTAFDIGNGFNALVGGPNYDADVISAVLVKQLYIQQLISEPTTGAFYFTGDTVPVRKPATGALATGTVVALTLTNTTLQTYTTVTRSGIARDADTDFNVFYVWNDTTKLFVPQTTPAIPTTVSSIATLQSWYVAIGSPNNKRLLTSSSTTANGHAVNLANQLNTLYGSAGYVFTATNDPSGANSNYSKLAIGRTGATQITQDETQQAYTNNVSKFNSFDTIAQVTAISKTGEPLYLFPTTNNQGVLEKDLHAYTLPVFAGNLYTDNNPVVAATKTTLSLVNDETNLASTRSKPSIYNYIDTIELSFDQLRDQPGFIFCPEGFAIQDPNRFPTANPTELRSNYLALCTVLNAVAVGLDWFAVIDPQPTTTNFSETVSELRRIKGVVSTNSGHSAYYAPWLIDVDQNLIPPSGFVVGTALRRYNQEGFENPPAGVRFALQGTIGTSYVINALQQETSYEEGLNPIRSIPGKGIVIYGARTLSTNNIFKQISGRIILNVLIDALRRSYDEFIFENIDSSNTLFEQIRLIAINLCQQLYNIGALYGATPSDAYNVIVDETNNSLAQLEAGNVAVDVFVATTPTLERIFITVSKTSLGQVSVNAGTVDSVTGSITFLNP